jgi:REP element-mobilizing transposase RayT
MVIAYHLIWTLYGWWLPNDPRGSASNIIRADHISELGRLHQGRKRVQPSSREIREFYDVAETRLKHPLLTLTPADVGIVAGAFAEAIRDRRYTCYACAIMPDHVHILIRKHRNLAEDMIEHLQRASRDRLTQQGARTSEHPTWGGPGWKVFLDTPDDIHRIIKYVDDNPIKARLPRQHHAFVTPYDNWPHHPTRRRTNRPA